MIPVWGFPLGFRAENTRMYEEKATTMANGMCPTLSASMGMGGGYIPMILIEEKDVLSKSDGSSNGEQSSGELLRTGCIQRDADNR